AAYEGRANVVSLHTCGKGLGGMGALVLAPQVLRDFLINRCRPFIYSTAPSPLVAALVRASLLVCRFDGGRRQRLHQLVAHAGRRLQERCAVTPTDSQIQPVIVGSDERAMRLASPMQARGFDVRAVRPPTVPEGT